MKYIRKIKYCLNFVLPVVLLFQLTLPTIKKGKNLQINFGELTLGKCNNPEHSHPPLSERESTDDLVKFVNSEATNLFVVSSLTKFFIISGEKNFKNFTTRPEFLLALFTPVRGPPYFEV